MTGRFILFQIPHTLAETAFAFHESLASTNPHIWSRDRKQIQRFAENGELFGVRRSDTGEIVALCYVTLDEESQEFEVGGLTVAHSVQGLGLATTLVSFAIAHAIAWNSPWAAGQEIIAHVHQSNEEPRNLLRRIGFRHVGIVTAPDGAPASMKRNAQGKVVGDKFVFPHAAAHQLSSWLDTFKGLLPDRQTPAEIEEDLDSLRAVLRAEAADATNR